MQAAFPDAYSLSLLILPPPPYFRTCFSSTPEGQRPGPWSMCHSSLTTASAPLHLFPARPACHPTLSPKAPALGVSDRHLALVTNPLPRAGFLGRTEALLFQTNMPGLGSPRGYCLTLKGLGTLSPVIPQGVSSKPEAHSRDYS